MNYCPKHHIPMRLTEIGRGKTIYVCDMCEKERQEKLAALFGTARSSHDLRKGRETG
jgi:hypothetical protein